MEKLDNGKPLKTYNEKSAVGNDQQHFILVIQPYQFGKLVST